MKTVNESTAQKTFSILERTNTNWSVEKLPLSTKCGKTTDSYGLFRSDNSAHLGTFKESYQPMQNAKLVELLVQATDLIGLDITKGGTLRNGGRVYYQMELPSMYIGRSDVKRFVTALNSHDGSSCIAFGSSNTVVICNNTFNKVHREMDKVKHTVNSFDRVKAMADNLRETIQRDLLMFENFSRMADTPMRDEMVERLVKKLFGAEAKDQLSDLSTRRKNQVAAFADSLNTEIGLEGKTVWGLFNAVTRYTNHVGAPKDNEKKADYLMNGTGAKLNGIAFDDLMQWIEKNTTEYHFVNA